MSDTLEARYVRACETNNLGLRTRLGIELETAARAGAGRLDAPDALLKAALWYARRGVAVFPCEYRGKRPLTPNGFKDASTDPARIQAWWSGVEPWWNIGAPTGITFDVIDIDGPEGVANVYGQDSPTLPAEIGHALTARDAGHHIYIAPTGRGNTTNMLPGVDYRGAGGYVILPPSIGANGKRYVWTKPLDLTA